jgi:hypothetical protein
MCFNEGWRTVKEQRINVVSYAGYRGEERPRRFRIDDEPIDVVEVLRSWIVEEKESGKRKRFFKVRGSDGYIHTMYYDESGDEWFLS